MLFRSECPQVELEVKYRETSGSLSHVCFVLFCLFVFVVVVVCCLFLKEENTYKLENLLKPPGDLAKGFLFIDCSAYKLRTNPAAC